VSINPKPVSFPLTIRMGRRRFFDELALDEWFAYQRAKDVLTENSSSHDAQEGISAIFFKPQAELDRRVSESLLPSFGSQTATPYPLRSENC